MSNRPCEQRPYVRFHAIVDSDRTMKLAELTNAIQLMNAAVAATIVLDRMMRNGRVGWRRKMMNGLLPRPPDTL